MAAALFPPSLREQTNICSDRQLQETQTVVEPGGNTGAHYVQTGIWKCVMGIIWTGKGSYLCGAQQLKETSVHSEVWISAVPFKIKKPEDVISVRRSGGQSGGVHLRAGCRRAT